MGNKNYKVVPENYKMASQKEINLRPGLRKYEGCGNNITEALERLKEVCEAYEIPTPMPVPDDKYSYYCGIITFDTFFKSEKKLNTVCFTNIGNKYIAHIYYYINKHDF
ncbi:hypothetical protein Indivirus_7_14 [Indivirus ILV1]|uniref:Uncharacterized protein n=1 Tax=Indivirus ILV1 TaxID=1977633 RepID=A0A1V0SEC9_9VIRU|nr:hypothetical protein Indivirus_7_14 [Indivirus ILV1]